MHHQIECMYNIVWKKYLPVIRLLMKKATAGDQVLGLNRTDFEKDKVVRKTSARFTCTIVKGFLQYNAALSPMGRDLLVVLQEDPVTSSLLQQNEFVFSMSNRYELHIHCEPKPVVESEATAADAEAILPVNSVEDQLVHSV